MRYWAQELFCISRPQDFQFFWRGLWEIESLGFFVYFCAESPLVPCKNDGHLKITQFELGYDLESLFLFEIDIPSTVFRVSDNILPFYGSYCRGSGPSCIAQAQKCCDLEDTSPFCRADRNSSFALYALVMRPHLLNCLNEKIRWYHISRLNVLLFSNALEKVGSFDLVVVRRGENQRNKAFKLLTLPLLELCLLLFRICNLLIEMI